jgi:cell division septum initiation protein DivIVA
VVAREDLGHATGHLLPAIAVLAQKVLGLPVKPTDEQKQIRRLERQLARARETAKGSRAARREVDRLRAALEELRAELAEARAESARVRAACGEACGCREPAAASTSDPAVRVVDAAVTALLTRPPAGVEPGEVAGFARRHRDRLIALVRAQVVTVRTR